MINWCADWLDLTIDQHCTVFRLSKQQITSMQWDKWTIIYLIDQYARLYRSYGYLRIRKATLMQSLLTDIINAFSIEINYLPQAAHWAKGKKQSFLLFPSDFYFCLCIVYTKLWLNCTAWKSNTTMNIFHYRRSDWCPTAWWHKL